MSRLYVMSLGGSLIVPDLPDARFLKSFRKFIMARTKRGDRFVIVTGGGQVCRNYNDALKQAGRPSFDDLEWMGIEVTRLNAKLVQLLFGSTMAHPKIIRDPNKKVAFREKILVAGGWKPGRSSDDCAVRLGRVYGSTTIINLSNVDYVYDKDPRKYKTARKIEAISWTEYLRTFGGAWNPGAHVPFDPVASRSAKKYKQKVIIANGADLGNLGKILDGKKFKGTVIE